MGSLIGGALSLIGSLFKGLFSTKEAQVQSASKLIDLANSVATNDGNRDSAVAQIIAAEASSGSWLAANWRPLFMVLFMGIISARWFFGYQPKFMSVDEIMRLYDLVELGIGGYIGGRTLEKIASTVQMGKILQSVLEKNKII